VRLSGASLNPVNLPGPSGVNDQTTPALADPLRLFNQ
jgi:hypothetical protein